MSTNIQQSILSNDLAPLKIYVDGSYDHGTHSYAFGAVVLAGEELIKVSQAYKPSDDIWNARSMHNVAGEIMGAAYAMEYARLKGYKSLNIFHDYEGISKWCTGEWRATKEFTQMYQALYKEAASFVDIKFTKVAAHTGNKYNEMADSLAKAALGK